VALRKKDGTVSGPYTCVAGITPKQIVTTEPIEDTFYFDGINEPPFFMFGKSNEFCASCTVLDVTPSDSDDGVEIKAVVYRPEIHSFDGVPTPLKNSVTTITVPALPVVSGFTVINDPANSTRVTLVWNPALGAQSYIIQQSLDGVHWDNVNRVSTTTYSLPVRYGYLYLRIAAVNVGQGAWAVWEGQVGVSLANPVAITGLSLRETWLGLTLKVGWGANLAASRYRVTVYQDAGATQMRETDILDNNYDYTFANAQEDDGVGPPPSRNLRIGVVGINGVGVESPTETVIDCYNAPPAVLTGLNAIKTADDGVNATYSISFTPTVATDFDFYRIWGSVTTGFTPAGGNLQYEGPASSFVLVIPLTLGVHDPFYWKAAAYDKWDSSAVNISAEQTITYVP
jgi:hypothetical protein